MSERRVPQQQQQRPAKPTTIVMPPQRQVQRTFQKQGEKRRGGFGGTHGRRKKWSTSTSSAGGRRFKMLPFVWIGIIIVVMILIMFMMSTTGSTMNRQRYDTIMTLLLGPSKVMTTPDSANLLSSMLQNDSYIVSSSSSSVTSLPPSSTIQINTHKNISSHFQTNSVEHSNYPFSSQYDANSFQSNNDVHNNQNGIPPILKVQQKQQEEVYYQDQIDNNNHNYNDTNEETDQNKKEETTIRHHSRSHSHSHSRPYVQVSKNDFVMNFKGNSSPYVLESHKLIFFTIQKTGCTVWKQLFRRMLGYDDWRTGPTYPPSKAKLIQLRHYDINHATMIMNDPSYTRAIFVRDPKDRFLSAYLDKCVYTNYTYENCCLLKKMKNITKRNVCYQRTKSFVGFMKLTERCKDTHWEPYHTRMEEKYLPLLDFVGHTETSHDDAKKLLQKIGAWEEYGKSGWGLYGNESIFQSTSFVLHKTSSSSSLLSTTTSTTSTSDANGTIHFLQKQLENDKSNNNANNATRSNDYTNNNNNNNSYNVNYHYNYSYYDMKKWKRLVQYYTTPNLELRIEERFQKDYQIEQYNLTLKKIFPPS